jgi:DNA-binding LacI/PurR family transcriptional regulator
MTCKIKKRNRKSIKAENLVKLMKSEISSGNYRSGDLLPTREQLRHQYNTSKVTLQKSIEQLEREGFIDIRGTVGTYVAEKLPFNYQIGIVVPEKFKKLMLYSSIIEAIKKIESRTPYKFKIYHMFDYKEQLEIKQLKDDVKSSLLAGIVLFYIDSSEFDTLKICENNELPILSLVNEGAPKTENQSNINYISFNYKALIDHTIKNLNDRNLKKVAWIANELFSKGDHEYLMQQCQEKDICTKPHWIHGITLDEHSYRWTPNIIKLLTESEKLDAVVVLNENLLDGVLTGLDECKINFDDEIQVISHFSFPHNLEKFDGVSKMGFDIHRFLTDGIKIIHNIKLNGEYHEHLINDIKIENAFR